MTMPPAGGRPSPRALSMTVPTLPDLTGLATRTESLSRNSARVAIVLAIASLPFLRPSGPGKSGVPDMALIVLVLATTLWASRNTHVLRMPYAVPIGLSLLAGGLSAMLTGHGGLTLVKDAVVFGWALALANLGRDPRMLRTAFRAFAYLGVLSASLMIIGVFLHITLLSGQTAKYGARAAFRLGDANYAASYFLLTLFILRAAQLPRRRGARWLCCLVLITAMVLTGSNGEAIALVLGTVLGCAAGLVKRGKGDQALIVTGLALCATLGAATAVNPSTFAQQATQTVPFLKNSVGREAESVDSRSSIVSESLHLYLTAGQPMGIGPGQTKSRLLAAQAPYVKETHNDYAASLVERGPLGAAATILLVAMLLIRARRISMRGALRADYAAIVPRPELLAVAVAAALFSSLFYEVLHFRHAWALFGLVAAVELWGRESST
jgi:hypothetical protein